jgi:hypothetical protein
LLTYAYRFPRLDPIHQVSFSKKRPKTAKKEKKAAAGTVLTVCTGTVLTVCTGTALAMYCVLHSLCTVYCTHLNLKKAAAPAGDMTSPSLFSHSLTLLSSPPLTLLSPPPLAPLSPPPLAPLSPPPLTPLSHLSPSLPSAAPAAAAASAGQGQDVQDQVTRLV